MHPSAPPPPPVRSDAAMALTILGLGCFLALTGVSLVERWQRSASRQQHLAFEDLLGMLSIAAGLLIAAWWVLSLMAAFTAAMCERAGLKHAAALSGRCSPAFMRRLALAAVGVQLIGAPLAHAENMPAAGTDTSGCAAVAGAWAPTESQSPQSTTAQSTTAQVVRQMMASNESAPENASAGQPEPGAADVQPQWQPHPPVITPGLVTSAPVRASREQQGATARSEVPRTDVVVRSGDSLWTIAAEALGPGASDVEIALEWPRWFEANRAAIGANPDVLLPGQILRSP
ncbi:LysM peptidoglycan-binding domain-containing protein [Arthrobacter sp. ISL-28]|uniref:LysM peptidoglycan-binding domain-containing protein n=1 Tax=Arthrobacter sp. ISL-28 TaxID=2819108 RepID=UPI001BE9E526|nr:hypothetical protein [Arthrobacter sp. ISL-28]MBT2522719.1 hypothetical protein [Arthrobacter sp. ISL-28]